MIGQFRGIMISDSNEKIAHLLGILYAYSYEFMKHISYYRLANVNSYLLDTALRILL